MMQTVGQVAEALNAQAMGQLDLPVSRPRPPQEAGADDLALAMEPSYGDALMASAAHAAVVWPDCDWQSYGLKAAIIAPRSRYAMAGLTRVFDIPPDIAPGIHPSAVIAEDAQIGANAAIGPFVVIGAGVVIGANARIGSHVAVAEGAKIGSDALLMSGVRIGARVEIGDRFICGYNSVVGGDGFSFVTPQAGAIEEARRNGYVSGSASPMSFTRINSLGGVRVGDDVEMGALSTIDRGTVADTVVGNGCKMDDHVHIGHNVTTGSDCLFCGQVGIAGSTVIGDRVVLGGQVGVTDHLVVGNDVIAGARSSIMNSVKAQTMVMGTPAVKREIYMQTYKAQRRLPRLAETVAQLQKKVSNLTGNG